VVTGSRQILYKGKKWFLSLLSLIRHNERRAMHVSWLSRGWLNLSSLVIASFSFAILYIMTSRDHKQSCSKKNILRKLHETCNKQNKNNNYWFLQWKFLYQSLNIYRQSYIVSKINVVLYTKIIEVR
jgi:hypothetical protein